MCPAPASFSTWTIERPIAPAPTTTTFIPALNDDLLKPWNAVEKMSKSTAESSGTASGILMSIRSGYLARMYSA